MASGDELPPGFDIVGMSEDSTRLLNELDNDIREYFYLPRPVIDVSVTVKPNARQGERLQVDDVSDNFDLGIENNSADKILTSPVIQSRIRDFFRHNDIEENAAENYGKSDSSGRTCSNHDNFDLISELNRRKEQCKHGWLSQLKVDELFDHRLNVTAMDRNLRDMLIMGQLLACGTSSGDETRDGARKRHRFDYQFLNYSVCRDCFLYLNDISDVCLKNIRRHMYNEGVVQRVHGNSRKTPKHAVTFDDTKRVVYFITRYAEEYGLPQPAAPRGRDDIPPVYLPGRDTYKSVYQKYQECCGAEERCLSETTFRRIWHKVLPQIKFITPRTDVCHKCEQYRDLIQKARTEEDKLHATATFGEHIHSAQVERDYYRRVCAAARQEHNKHPRPEALLRFRVPTT